jgi:RNA polymerase sigma factor (sigma-70 family)
MNKNIKRILTDKEKMILKLRFGFEGSDEYSLEQIGKMMQLTRERVRQIQARALTKLKDHPSTQFLRDYL